MKQDQIQNKLQAIEEQLKKLQGKEGRQKDSLDLDFEVLYGKSCPVTLKKGDMWVNHTILKKMAQKVLNGTYYIDRFTIEDWQRIYPETGRMRSPCVAYIQGSGKEPYQVKLSETAEKTQFITTNDMGWKIHRKSKNVDRVAEFVRVR